MSRNMRTDNSNKYVHCFHAIVEISANSVADIYFWFPVFSRMAGSEKPENVLGSKEPCAQVWFGY